VEFILSVFEGKRSGLEFDRGLKIAALLLFLSWCLLLLFGMGMEG
jgi:hypothetical protein